MKLIDRLLVVRRALIIACNPKTEVVLFRYKNSDGTADANCVFSDRALATKFYKDTLVDMFIQYSTDSSYLRRVSTAWLDCIQIKWNTDNPDDPINFFE